MTETFYKHKKRKIREKVVKMNYDKISVVREVHFREDCSV